MGYTHYWVRPKVVGPGWKWMQAMGQCQNVCQWLEQTYGFRLLTDRDMPGVPVPHEQPAEFNSAYVRLNGVGDLGHETFLVRRVFHPSEYAVARQGRRGPWSDFCKTERKPYDVAVCACLIVLNHWFPRFRPDSDSGDDAEGGWPLARAACQHVLGYGDTFRLTLVDPVGPFGLKSGEPTRYKDEVTWPLSNGWRLTRRPQSGPWTVEVTWYDKLASGVYNSRKVTYDVGNSNTTLYEACWNATCEFVGHLLRESPCTRVGEFVRMARECGGWEPFVIMDDALQDAGDDLGAKLLHRVLSKVPRPYAAAG
jgi:hypothetical protein